MFNKILLWCRLIKIEHTVFSLPFMLVTMFMADILNYGNLTLSVLILGSICLIASRNIGMTLNRIIDVHIDKKNTRTQSRELPAGLINIRSAWIFCVINLLILLYTVSYLPQLCLYLLPVLIIGLFVYSYTKRFTYLCHIFLGICLGGASLGGWIIITGELFNSIIPWLLSAGIMLWVAGFDIIYALQDELFDKENNLYSIPAQFGQDRAISISRVLHILCITFYSFIYLYFSNIWYLVAVLIICLGLIYEHYLIHCDLANIPKAFFHANAYISTLFCLVIFVIFVQSH